MEAFKEVTDGIPAWLQRLDDFGDNCVKRQAELAVSALTDKSAETRSMRNEGSLESLIPKKGIPAVIAEPPGTYSPTQNEKPPDEAPDDTPDEAADEADDASHHRLSESAKEQQGPAVIPQKVYYYDSNVQDFFEDLEGFVSCIGNRLRKAKNPANAAKVAKRLAEMVSQDGKGESYKVETTLPSPRCTSHSRKLQRKRQLSQTRRRSESLRKDPSGGRASRLLAIADSGRVRTPASRRSRA